MVLRGFGVTGRGAVEVTPDPPSIMGSVSKPLTAVAVLQQVGRLDGSRVLAEAGVDAILTPPVAATLDPWARQPEASDGLGCFVGGTPFGPTPVVFRTGASPDLGAGAGAVSLLTGSQPAEAGSVVDASRLVTPGGCAPSSLRGRPIDVLARPSRTVRRPAAGPV